MYQLATAQTKQSIKSNQSRSLPIHEIKKSKTETSMPTKSGNQSPNQSSQLMSLFIPLSLTSTQLLQQQHQQM